jgi:hypothetical protein
MHPRAKIESVSDSQRAGAPPAFLIVSEIIRNASKSFVINKSVQSNRQNSPDFAQ